ncbi:Bifunctional ligase/repressor BirA [Paraconexibacter sp. AEG42_29]|uniref:biotin--[biotin carboxyl-carrier protein] ligase n=1 Tax=Paraconexibacter sp. AEG42_29 TaxID=2997339 RepID=A0AAU7B2Z6_9ACTN
MSVLGRPRLHLRETTSTNERARAAAAAGAPHGLLVTADAQTAGRGRQGRTWAAPPGHALLLSVLLRDPVPLLPLYAAVAVAETVASVAPDRAPGIKWPNDVHLDGRKVAGILVEGRPQERWAVLGIGLNVAVDIEELPAELHGTAATLGLQPTQREPVLAALLDRLEEVLALTTSDLLEAWRARDVLRGREVRWASGSGTAAGVDGDGRLVVELDGGGRTALDAGEVHLGRGAG